VCEDVIWHLFSTLNGTDPLLNALSAKFPDGSYCFTIAFSLIGIPILHDFGMKWQTFRIFSVAVKLQSHFQKKGIWLVHLITRLPHHMYLLIASMQLSWNVEIRKFFTHKNSLPSWYLECLERDYFTTLQFFRKVYAIEANFRQLGSTKAIHNTICDQMSLPLNYSHAHRSWIPVMYRSNGLRRNKPSHLVVSLPVLNDFFSVAPG